MGIKCIAFDCFGTVFDMANVPQQEIRDYVRHVRSQNFSPYKFHPTWWDLPAHPDASQGIKMLQSAGFKCIALSNGDVGLIRHISRRADIWWYLIVNLIKHKVYKPHEDAYRTIEKDLGIPPNETLMVTANPTFGDIEGSALCGMQSQIIRQPGHPADIIELAELLINPKQGE